MEPPQEVWSKFGHPFHKSVRSCLNTVFYSNCTMKVVHYIQVNPRIFFSKNVVEQSSAWLYSDRTEHFCGRGAQILTKLLEGVPYMEKMISSPSEPFLAIRVCQKCQKTKKHEKPGFWGNFGYISKTVKSIFMIFWDKTPLTNT